jgi:hypothetical protein
VGIDWSELQAASFGGGDVSPPIEEQALVSKSKVNKMREITLCAMEFITVTIVRPGALIKRELPLHSSPFTVYGKITPFDDPLPIIKCRKLALIYRNPRKSATPWQISQCTLHPGKNWIDHMRNDCVSPII